MKNTDASAIDRVHMHIESLLGALAHVDNAGILEVARVIASTFRRGGSVFAAGNGGSAAQAQHFVGELVGRYQTDRTGLRAIALGTDTVTASAIGNDFGFRNVFARELEALGRQGDLLVVFTTSGESENIRVACARAREMGLSVAAFVGPARSSVAKASDHFISTPEVETSTIQELHLVGLHAVCTVVERDLR